MLKLVKIGQKKSITIKMKTPDFLSYCSNIQIVNEGVKPKLPAMTKEQAQYRRAVSVAIKEYFRANTTGFVYYFEFADVENLRTNGIAPKQAGAMLAKWLEYNFYCY